MLGRAAQLCRHGSVALAPMPGSPAASAGGRLSFLGAEPGGSPTRRYLERYQLVFSRKGAILFQPSPKALHREAAFKVEKAQLGEQPQAGPERGGTHSRAAALALCQGSRPWGPNPPPVPCRAPEPTSCLAEPRAGQLLAPKRSRPLCSKWL